MLDSLETVKAVWKIVCPMRILCWVFSHFIVPCVSCLYSSVTMFKIIILAYLQYLQDLCKLLSKLSSVCVNAYSFQPLQFGLMEVPDMDNLTIGADDEDDDGDLEAELLALTGGERKPKKG